LEQGKLKIPKQIEQTQAQLVAGDVKVKWNKDRLDRYQMLLKDGAIDRDRYNEQLNNYLTAVANKEEIVKRIEELNASGREEIVQLQAALEETQLALRQKQTSQKVEIAQSQVAVKAAEARLLRVKVDLENAIIRAPFDGIITQKNAEPGEIVSPSLGAGSSSIVEIAQGLKIEAKVPEVDISQLKVGQQVNVIAEAYPDSVFQGKIIAIAPEAIEEQNVTSFKVEVGLVNGKDKLLSKMNVDVKFIGKKLTNSLVIPTVAIVTDKGQTGVMIPDVNNKPKFQPITIGLTIDNQTQIIEGIKAGDRVYIDLPEDKNKPKQPE
jgi:HlyD family secretion protein